jgi:hypothetical protein
MFSMSLLKQLWRINTIISFDVFVVIVVVHDDLIV